MNAKNIESLKDYSPSLDEQYMNPKQISYFKETLETWRLQSQYNLSDAEKRLAELNASDEHDEMDKAFIETEVSLIINKISALQNLLNEIDVALGDIEIGNYGYCKKSGKEIGIKRLMAKPTSRFAIKAQEDTEKETQIKQKFEEEEIEGHFEENENEIEA